MRKNLLWLLLIIICVALQSTWVEAMTFRGVTPNLVLLLVVYFALNDSDERAMFTGALGGLFQDVVADKILGHYVLCNVVVAYAAGRIGQRLITDHPAVKVGIVFGSGIVHGLLFVAISYVQDPGSSALYAILANAVPSAFYTAVLTPVVFLVLDRSRRRHAAMESGVILHD